MSESKKEEKKGGKELNVDFKKTTEVTINLS